MLSCCFDGMVHLSLAGAEDIDYWTDRPILQLKLCPFVELEFGGRLKDPAVDADCLHLGIAGCHYQLKYIAFASADLFDVAEA